MQKSNKNKNSLQNVWEIGPFIKSSQSNLSSCIYLIDSHDHPFDLHWLPKNLISNISIIFVHDWDGDLTPWSAKGLYVGDSDFKGLADNSLKILIEQIIPEIEKTHNLTISNRGLAGYSLGGLFALYSFVRTNSQDFSAIAAMSASVWYDNWLEFLNKAQIDIKNRFAFLSIGDKECFAKPDRLQNVQINMEKTAQILKSKGITVQFFLEAGSHVEHIPSRLSHGLHAVDDWLNKR